MPVSRIGLLAGVVDGDDRGMVEPGGRLSLAAEPGLEGRVGGQVGTQLLDRNGSPEPGVDSTADLRHAAAPEQVTQLVASSDRRWAAQSSPCPLNPVPFSAVQTCPDGKCAIVGECGQSR